MVPAPATKETAIIKYHLLTFGPDLIFPVLEKKDKIYLIASLRGNYLASVSGMCRKLPKGR